ncbi:MAG: DUF3179 domain-containing protein [Gemmatimonadota bacterium]|nr:DUF3179 domain-containing protein [Gemmatimonadota bacterium]
MIRSRRVAASRGAAGLSGLILLGCSADPTGSGGPSTRPPPSNQIQCSIPLDQIFSGGVDRGQIPDLTNPLMVDAGHPDTGYLADSDRVIGLRLQGDWIAVPHNILWAHEIINFTMGSGGRVAVTYCPLTGSSLAFDMGSVSRFIVSGLLFNNNLMMVDGDTESLWPQMSRGARCGPRDGQSLLVLPSIEITWAGWKELHPDTRVVSGVTGFTRDYTDYPYDLYEDPNAPPLYEVPEPDRRRQVKERVLGVPGGSGSSMAFPFFALANAGDLVAAHETIDGRSALVLWDSQAASAVALRPEVDGQALTFEVQDGEFRDLETNSTWRLDGLAVSGPLAGSALEPISDAFVSFWFAWSTFEPGTRIWGDS